MSESRAPLFPTDIEQRFLDFIAAPNYPCVGAKAALTHGHIDFVVADDLRSPNCDAGITRGLQRFATDTTKPDMFVSMVALFANTPSLSE